MLPGGVQIPASHVYEAMILANATLLLDDGRFLEAGSYGPLGIIPPQVTSSNWIGYAWANRECVYYPEWGYPICEHFYKAFTGYWNIPSDPVDPDNVVLYIFNGMQPSSSGSFPLLQPVLQWGDNGGWGGLYWSMASWYVTGYGEVIYSTPMLGVDSNYVDAHGGIGWLYSRTYEITSTVLNSDCRAGYYSCPQTSLTVDTSRSSYGFISVVLEGYWHDGFNWGHLDNCNQLPGDIHFTSLEVVDTGGYLQPASMEETEDNAPGCPGFEVNILNGYSVDIITG